MSEPELGPLGTVTGMREPVTLVIASAILGRSENALRHLMKEGKIRPRACFVETRELLFEMWEIEGALMRRPARRRVARG